MREQTKMLERKLGRHSAAGNRRPTFRDLLEQTREQAAAFAWERARLASCLRHLAADAGRYGAARALGSLKQRAIERAIGILPDAIRVAIDDDLHVGMLSVRWRGHGRLHLPAHTQLQAATTGWLPDSQLITGEAVLEKSAA